MYDNNIKDQVRQATDIVDLIGGTLELRRQGRMFVALCPWHADSRPSLQVNPQRQSWKCWVCDIGGDVFSYQMQREGVDFREALQMLADRAGIVLQQERQKKVEPGSPDDKNALYQTCLWAEKQFHEYLLRSEAAEHARRYIEERGITPASVERFRVGFAPDSWSWLLDRSRGTPHSPALLEATGLVGKSERGSLYDRFKGRVIFPIHDSQGRAIAFGGRILPGQTDANAAKYINSPETRLFSKSEQLYALDLARNQVGKTRAITVVEGYTDVILCHQYGAEDVVAVLGTALGQRHLPLLRRFADTVYLVLDGDEAGQRRTNDIVELFIAAQLDLRIVTPPDELDPAELLIERGAEAWKALLTTAVDALEHKIRVATRGIDLVRDTHRANTALEEILRTLARGAAPNPSDLAGLRIKQVLQRLSTQFRLEEADVRGRFNELRKAAKPVESEIAAPRFIAEADYRLPALSLWEVGLLELFTRFPELAPTALGELGEDDLTSTAAREVFRTYRELEEAGESLDFGSVLGTLESPQLKSLLVAIDEQAERKLAKSTFDPPTQLRQTLNAFRRDHEERLHRQRQAELAAPHFAQEEKNDILAELIAAKRRQQGISAPTEG